MSEMSNENFQVPAEQSFDTETFQGSMQQVLQDNIGAFVSVDFLIGTQNFVTKQGVLFWVGSQFIVLYEQSNQQYVISSPSSLLHSLPRSSGPTPTLP